MHHQGSCRIYLFIGHTHYLLFHSFPIVRHDMGWHCIQYKQGILSDILTRIGSAYDARDIALYESCMPAALTSHASTI
jgi:hypothetical protein